MKWPCLSKLTLLKKFLEVVDSPRPKRYMWNKKKEPVSSKKQWLWHHVGNFFHLKNNKMADSEYFFWKNLPFFYMGFFMIKTERDWKKILRGTIVTKILNKMRNNEKRTKQEKVSVRLPCWQSLCQTCQPGSIMSFR